ncbi:YybH family protein [Nocardia sp. NBC_01329]|uniref:YybH family protein n=1 Tax=Nocardia sp. NBC_01329 TaxID=2903594 RepID=UPI002E0E2543|nr:SgcJ/EcaC family oxidoreductase [Nocardia sp. NBC_01329]
MSSHEHAPSIARPTAGISDADTATTVEIQALFRTLESALEAKDAAAFDQPFTEDVVFITPAGAIFRGWDEMHSYHRKVLGDSPDARAHFELLALRLLTPEHAVVNVEQTLHTAEFSIANRGTWVLLERNGSWWVCSVHNTNVAGSAEGRPTGRRPRPVDSSTE